MSKYKAKPHVIDNIRFASQKEAKRYAELKLLQKAGEIRELELQPEFPLHVLAMHRTPTLEGDIVTSSVGVYRADFSYRDGRSGRQVIEDVKGFKTPLYRWKKRHVMA